jgi:AMP nucleosidase
MEAADHAGRYPQLTVERPWSVHNPVLEGEFASPKAIRWYLERELSRLAASGARISVSPGREALDLHDPSLASAVDETRWDPRRKKLFLFPPERMALSIDRLQHYTGTPAESFQRYVLLTNYSWHVEEFRIILPGCSGPDSNGRQMPAWHHVLPGRSGVTMVNIGVGPSNAKTITDHLAVLRPDLVLMIGHCAGLRNHQETGIWCWRPPTCAHWPKIVSVNRAPSPWTWSPRPWPRTDSATESPPPPCSQSARNRFRPSLRSARTPRAFLRRQPPPAAASTSRSRSP